MRSLAAALLVASAATAAAEEPPKIALSGYLQLEADLPFDGGDLDDETANSTFRVRRARLRAAGEVAKGLGYAIMLDPRSSQVLQDAYVSLRFIPHHELRLGQQKTQFGYENPESSTKLLTVDRAFVSEALGRGPDRRDIGVGLFGNWYLGNGFGLDYQLTLVNGSGRNQLEDATPRKNLWGRAGVNWSWGTNIWMRAGFSYANGHAVPEAAVAAHDFWRVGGDLELSVPWLFIAVELVQGDDDDVTGRGFYATVVGKTEWDAGAILRVESFDPDVGADGDRLTRVTVGGYYDHLPVEARLIFNLEVDKSEAERDHALILWGQVTFD